MEDTIPTILAMQMRIINRFLFLQDRPFIVSGETALYPSELHLLDAVQGNPQLSATEIAGLLGITKGAVSQTLRRLMKKGIISIEKDRYDKNRLTVHFTGQGRYAYDAFNSKRSAQLQEMIGRLQDYTDEERGIIGRYLNDMDRFVELLQK
jgi:DNA-binding MarR family transcriptional regulator